MKQPLVSIIMPAYNAKSYLPRSIESIINQTYPNWEFLIVDDGSVDGSIDLCQEYEKNDQRIRLICNVHGGTACARNTALDMAKGDYIAFLDADDAYHSKYLEYMVNAALKNDCDVALCATIRGTDANEFFLSEKEAHFSVISVDEGFAQMYGGNWPDMIAPYTKLYAKHLFDRVRFPAGMYFEDAATMNLAIYYSNRIIQTDEPLYFYNITPNSSSVTKRSVELLDREKALRSHWEFYLQEERKDLVLLNMPFYLVELISIYHRIKGSDNPSDCEQIREKFENVYRIYKRKVIFSEQQKNQILAFQHPQLYDIRNMIRNEGVMGTLIGFVQRKICK